MDRDLKTAEECLQSMAEATDLGTFETEWEHFLYRIERVWERTEKKYKHHKAFQKWFSPYQELRKKDPLVRYLKQARNAETHSLQGTLSSPLNISLKEKYGRDFNIKSITTKLENKCLTINVESDDLILELDPKIFRTTPYVVRVKNRGKWFNPPTSHLGNPLNEDNPIILGHMGLDLCKVLVAESIEIFEHEKT